MIINQPLLHARIRALPWRQVSAASASTCSANALCYTTFSEQIPGLTTPFARRTPPLTSALAEVALALAGRPGSRLAAKLAMPCCRDVLIRLTCARRQGRPWPPTAGCAHLERLQEYVRSFGKIMAQRRGQELPAWLEAAEAGDLPELRSLAAGMRRDQPGIINGLTLEHNSGTVEGNVTRVKRLKRDGYGRAKFDLLGAQILLAA